MPEGKELEFLEPYRDQLPPELFTEPFEPPVTDGSGNIRAQLREARRLFAEAGWQIQNGRLTQIETGETIDLEILLILPESERFVQPFVRNLERAGIDASIRVVDTAQYRRRMDEFDFDLTSVQFNFFPPPGPEQRSYWGSAAADVRGSANYAAIRNPIVDELVEEVIAAEDLETLQAANRAMDRVLLWNHYVVPLYYNDEYWVAYWNMFRPSRTAAILWDRNHRRVVVRSGPRGNHHPSLIRPARPAPDARLHHQTAAVDHPDAARDNGAQLYCRAIRPRRTDRADPCGDPGHRRVGYRAHLRLRRRGDVGRGGQAGLGEAGGVAGKYRGAQGLDPEFIAEIERQFGFDKPPVERFLLMMGNYLTFDFGESYFRQQRVADLVIDKMPVSISLGLWTTLLVYLISIPLGIRKAIKDGSRFDVWTSGVVVVGYAIPSFLFAVLLIVVFAGGRYLDWFPLRGLVSDNWATLPWWEQILDYLWHITLPVLALVVSGFATLTMLVKNSFLDEINKQYVLTARAKGLTERQVLYGHVFRNAMLIVVAGFPSAFVGILFTGALFVEVIFSLDGLGLLGFEAAINRDYPVIFATLFVFTLVGLIIKLVEDVVYTVIDPRIDFERRGV